MSERRGLIGLVTAVGISTLGTRMSTLALPWFVLTTTGSPTQTGLVAAAEMTPYVVVQGLGGPLVDRVGAWRICVLTDIAAAVLFGAIPLLHAFGALPIGALIPLVMAAGALRGGGDAARYVLLPGVRETAGTPIERAAGLYDGVSRGASLVGAPLAGVLIGVTSALNVLALDAASFLVSAALVATLVPRSAEPGPSGAGGESPTSYLASLGEGFRYLRADRLLMGIGLMVMVTNLLDQASSAVLTPVWAKDVAHSSVALGLIGGVFSAGAVVGNITTTWLGHRLPRRRTYAVGFLLAGSPRMFAMALAATVSPVLVACVVGGLAAGAINPILGSIEYERVPRPLQARVLGVLGATAWAGIPFGALTGGALTEVLGIRTALAVTAAAYLVTTLAPFVLPAFRAMDRVDHTGEPVGPEEPALAAR
jgi:hypothetical protein